MSKAVDSRETDTSDDGALTAEERETFERILERHGDKDDLRKICEAVLYDDGSEEATS